MPTYTHSFTFTPPKRFGSGIGTWTEVRVEQSPDDTTFTGIDTLDLAGDHVAPSGYDVDPAAPEARSITTEVATLAEAFFRVVWIDGDGDESPASQSVQSPGTGAGGFATADDVENRLGRDLTDRERTLAETVIGEVTGLIADAVGRDSDWATDLDPVPPTLRALCVTKAIGAIVNPTNVAANSERLGAYQHSQTFPRSADGGVFLTDDEELRIRRAVFGTNAGSARPESLATEVYDNQLRNNITGWIGGPTLLDKDEE